MKRLYSWLDKYVLPWPVRFLTNPLVILCTFALLVPMIGDANAVVLVLVLNSYTNVTSVGVSSIVLRQTMLSAEAQEKRDMETHDASMEELKAVRQLLQVVLEEQAEMKATHQELHETHQELVRILSRFFEVGRHG